MEETRESCSKPVQGRRGEEEEKPSCELPLHEYVVASRLVKKRAYYRALLALRAALFFAFVAYRAVRVRDSFHGHKLELVALACEVAFAISFLLSMCYKWFVVERVAYPERLLSRWEELPRVDVFVTMADPIKESAVVTMNTVLSALALDYPAHKLACYVSDDGGSLLTLWALKEAVSFAKSWVPFCRSFSSYVYPRAPRRYFAHKTSATNAQLYGFYSEWHNIKGEYYAFENKIRSMSEAYCNSKKVTIAFLLNKLLETATTDGQKATYSYWAMNDDPCNHPSYCEIILEKPLWSTQMDLPYMVYMSREKRPKKKHHFKAGAMNALLRISGIMTNAPYIMNLDCDMYVNESKALLQAMCFFMQTRKSQDEGNIGFVQFPQCFEAVNEEDIYGTQMAALFEIIMKGMDGAQGPIYCGTGCIHKRESLYGRTCHRTSSSSMIDGSNLQEFFGHSQLFILNTQSILTNQVEHHSLQHHSLTQEDLMMESTLVTNCTYEDKTSWGKEVGLIYGSLTEDFMTSGKIHARGWRSLAYVPPLPTFLGSIPSTSEDTLIMRKRWSTGILEILFSPHALLLIDNSNGFSLIQRLIYIYFYTSLLQSLPLFIYTLLPCLSVVGESQIYPKIVDLGVLIPISLSLCYYVSNFYENMLVGVGVRQWWQSETMEIIVALSSTLLALYEVIKNKIMGVEQTMFAITPKEQSPYGHGTNYHDDDNQGQDKQGFIVQSTLPIFIPPTIVVLLNMTTLVAATMRTIRHLIMQEDFLSWSLSTELACSLWILFILQPFSNGVLLWALGKRGPFSLSSSTILHSSFIVMAFLSLVFISTTDTFF